jgi:hypothetical protein
MAAAYTEEEQKLFIEQIVILITQGKSISKACKEVGIATSSYMLWLSRSEQYARDHARAMESRADVIFEEIIEIADSTEDDIIMSDEGKPITNHNVIQRDRLRVDARKWIAAKMNPKKYSDKYSVDHTTKGESISSIERTIVRPNEVKD